MVVVWGPGAPEPPAAPPGAPEPEEAELEEDEGSRGGLDLCLKPAESRLISGGERHQITYMCITMCIIGELKGSEDTTHIHSLM